MRADEQEPDGRREPLPGKDRVKPERTLGAAKPPTANGVSNLRPSWAQVMEPPYTRSVRTVVWEGRAGNRSPYPDPAAPTLTEPGRGRSARIRTRSSAHVCLSQLPISFSCPGNPVATWVHLFNLLCSGHLNRTHIREPKMKTRDSLYRPKSSRASHAVDNRDTRKQRASLN